MIFLARFVLDNSGSLEKYELKAPSSTTTPKEKKFLHGVRVLLGYLHVRFDLLGSINFRDISGFPKLGPITLIRGHPRGCRGVPLDSTDMISDQSLIVLKAVSCIVSEL